jgi:hypothetical protein
VLNIIYINFGLQIVKSEFYLILAATIMQTSAHFVCYLTCRVCVVPSEAVNVQSINSVRVIWIKVGTILSESS